MSETQALIREGREPSAAATTRDAPKHWSLAPSALPGAQTPVPYPARAWRTQARLQVLRTWQEHLRRLSHHDPEFHYDPSHEYEADWTTDADYREDDVHLYQYGDEGVLVRSHGSFHSRLIHLMVRTLCLALGHRVCFAPDLHCSDGVSEALEQLTASGEPRTRRAPDVAVMPESWTLCEARERTVAERIIRLDRGDPAPELVFEVLSRTNDSKDFHDNLKLYAALGIPEYIIVDSGEFSDAPCMWLFRLDDKESVYRMVDRGTTLTACGISMRIIDAPVDGDVPVFQCRDTNGNWQDHEGQLRMATVLDMLELLLPQDMRRDVVAGLGEYWEQTGMPEDAKEIAAAIVRDPQSWRSLLVEPEGRASDADRSPPLRDTSPS
ncbi:MAG: Uma2 family endonuclease [Caldilineaceae bacterium SB0664_bin_22]|nr:Uma2 family endonuclease [Caldilineaceae bacterium SB0664_bin_22]